jgi:hypothetical protein
MANNYVTLDESFYFYLTVFFLLALPNSVHPKILTRFYSIYFKIPRKISAESDGRIEITPNNIKTAQIMIFFIKFMNFSKNSEILIQSKASY